MSKISKHPPKLWRGAVKVSANQYDLWALVPTKLGTIKREGLYWLTEDGMRFINSKDACDYMLKLKGLKPVIIELKGAVKSKEKVKSNIETDILTRLEQAIKELRQ